LIQPGVSLEMIAEAQDIFAHCFILGAGFPHTSECLQQLTDPFLDDF